MSVSKVNRYIHNQLKFDPILSNALIVGEVSNFKVHSSGHIYFSIKDEESKINCIMFASDAMSLNFEPNDGDSVEIRGNISVYEKEGRYQINVRQMMPVGLGELHQAFLAMKATLEKQGYFKNKQRVSEDPKRIGLITSPTGAAIKDVLTVLKKRHPLIEIIVYPVQVQGEKAAFQIATALDYFNESFPVDTLIICRGGGSIESLWPFNDMMVAEAIFNSKIPVISGVGHETDFTIADYVADLRAATPSEAAVMVCRPLSQRVDQVLSYKNLLIQGIKAQLKTYDHLFLKDYSKNMIKALENQVKVHYTFIDNAKHKMHNEMTMEMLGFKNKVLSASQKLNDLSPLNTLSRGYSLAMKDNKVIRLVEQVDLGDSIDIIVKNGIIKVDIVSKKEGHERDR